MTAEKSAFSIYIALLGLTVATVAAGALEVGRGAAVALTLAVAGIKGALIGWFYMHLKDESPLVLGIAVGALITAVILLAGLLPDLAFRRS